MLEQWKQVLNKMENEVTAVTYDLWVSTLKPVQYSNDELLLIAPSITAKNQVNQSAIMDKLTRIVREEFDKYAYVRVVDEKEYEENIRQQDKQEAKEEIGKACPFNKKYTFENFVVGKSNQVVFAAMQNVAEHPSQKFNPLFIYGGSGLGKTHLLHAVGNYLWENQPALNVLYVTCENFTNDYVDYLRNSKDKLKSEFRDKYRTADVLMIDDIQFISNRTGIQEEFFHTFNDLYQNNKQIIIASDRPPKEMSTLEDRLRSRFSMGLIQDIQEPDYETKVAIIKKKCSQEGYLVEPDVVDFIAQKVGTSVRDIEGLLSKIVFYASLLNKTHATMDDAHEALKDYGEPESTSLNADKIITTVCEFFKISKEDITGKKKNKEIVEPRQLCIYLINDMLNMPLVAIGDLFGGRDHTTIMHARDKVTKLIKTNPHTKTLVNDLKSRLLKC